MRNEYGILVEIPQMNRPNGSSAENITCTLKK